MKIATAVLLFSVTLFISACASTGYEQGSRLDGNMIASIKKGATTRSEIEQKFGKPDMTSMMGNGKRSAVYSYTSMTTPVFTIGSRDIKSRRDSLQVIYNESGVVEDYEYNTTSSMSRMDPWGGVTQIKKE